MNDNEAFWGTIIEFGYNMFRLGAPQLTSTSGEKYSIFGQYF